MIKVYALSGSHHVGKTMTFVYLQKLLPPDKFAFVGEFGHWILTQMGIRDTWREKIFTDRLAYGLFEDALDNCTIASYLVHKDKIIVADRSILDNCAYRLLANLPYATSLCDLEFRGVDLYTFFLRSKEREDVRVVKAMEEILTKHYWPYEEIWIIKNKPKETARIIADKILEMEENNVPNQFQNR